VIREARQTDAAYVTNTWVTSLVGPKLPGRQWGADGKEANAEVDALLNDVRTRVLVTCADDDVNAIRGWLAYAKVPGARVAMFCYVRKSFRREHRATQMLERAELLGPGAAVLYLYETHAARHLLPKLKTPTLMSPGDFL
jgi:hypothetical protein